MGKIIERLLQDADIVLFDAPPVMSATDAAVLATQVDGVLLVVNAGETKREQVRNAIERLQKVNANIVGSVLNNVPLDINMTSYYG
jgi:non-specific protein-tyrosine kinase